MKVTPAQYAKALLEAYEQVSGKERKILVRRFLTRLSHERRLRWLPAILRFFEKIKSQNRLQIRSARPLKPTWRYHLEKATDLKVDQVKIEPTLIGGFVLEVGDLRLDASLSGRISNLKKELCRV